MKKENIKIAPSILSADFSKMGEEVALMQACGADLIHCDIMDGVFVPNITFGIKMVRDIRKFTDLPLDCHLMIVEPDKYVDAFADAGADFITVHYEACRDKIPSVLSHIKNRGLRCGVAINPDTNPAEIKDIVKMADLILIMSVFPGFGGQSFIVKTLESVRYIRNIIDEYQLDTLIEIDGGINTDTAIAAKKAGVDILVAGSAIFSATDKKAAIDKLRKAL